MQYDLHFQVKITTKHKVNWFINIEMAKLYPQKITMFTVCASCNESNIHALHIWIKKFTSKFFH